jgi:hypothetical protein
MARPKKNITIDYAAIDAAPTGTMHKIAPIAEQAGASGPTVRDRLAEHYGERVTFKRGRKGGFTVAPAEEEAQA